MRINAHEREAYCMLALRLQQPIKSGVSLTEVLATGALLVAFVVLEMILLGRVFRASLLQTGQPPKLATFLGSMLKARRPKASS